MHFVHMTDLTRRPSFRRVTFCRLGFHARLVARCENERLCPNVVPLPQFEHFAIVHDPSNDFGDPPVLTGTGLYHKSP